MRQSQNKRKVDQSEFDSVKQCDREMAAFKVGTVTVILVCAWFQGETLSAALPK